MAGISGMVNLSSLFTQDISIGGWIIARAYGWYTGK
jgi:hypothetical protein